MWRVGGAQSQRAAKDRLGAVAAAGADGPGTEVEQREDCVAQRRRIGKVIAQRAALSHELLEVEPRENSGAAARKCQFPAPPRPPLRR